MGAAPSDTEIGSHSRNRSARAFRSGPLCQRCSHHRAGGHGDAGRCGEPLPLLYEVDYGGNAVNVFPTAANGDVAPTRSVTANGGSLSMPQGAAFDSQGNLWVANSAAPSIAEFTSAALDSRR